MIQKLLLCILGCLFTFSVDAQSLRNPVIQGFHPDPSVTRVGDWFYVVNSSFQYFPGVPIYKSKDLINWQQVGNVLNRKSQLPLNATTSHLGIYAPTLRYHNNKWYMITTNVTHGGNFLVTASKPEGPWSEPVWLEQQGIDPSLYFEGDKCYMVSNPNNTITLCEINPETGRTLSKGKPLWRGTGGRYPEGPHIYKKDGWYYLLISEGGTEMAHMLTIARSRNIYGPYEANPSNPILTNCNLAGQYSQIQGTGHGDLVQAGDGSWWMVFLAYRNYGGFYHHLGRETCIAPVEWPHGEWPVVNYGQPIDTLMTVKHLLAPQTPQPATDKSKGLNAASPEWLYIQNPDSSKYELSNNRFRLFGSVSSLSENNRPTFIGRRQCSPTINISTAVNAASLKAGDEAGVTIYQKHDGHYDLFVRSTPEGKGQIVLRYQIKSLCQETKVVPVNSINLITLNVSSDGVGYSFSAKTDDGQDIQMGWLESSLLSTEVVGGFTGVTNGMFVKGQGYADFLHFNYQEF